MRWFWSWWKHDNRGRDEAKELLTALEARDEHVAELGRQLRRVQRHNHFSDIVNRAITAREQP